MKCENCMCAPEGSCGEDNGCCGGCKDTESSPEESCCDTDESCMEELLPESRNGLDIGKFVVLSVVTGTLYHIYWFYRNWKHIKEYTKSSIRPTSRTVASVFPLLDIIMFCLQFKTIHGIAKKGGTHSFPLVWVCIGYTVFQLIGWTLFVSAFALIDPQISFALFFIDVLIAIFITLVLVPVQMSLNDLWGHTHDEDAPSRSYTGGEIAWIVVGSILLLLALVSPFVPPSAPGFDEYEQQAPEDTSAIQPSPSS